MSTSSAIKPELSVVICTLNERAAIEGVIAEVCASLSAPAFEIIVVDDGSTDGTPDAVRSLGLDHVRVIERSGVRGLASAAAAGWDAAGGDFLALMDGDGQHEADLVRRLYEALVETKSDMAVGVRDLSGGADSLASWRRTLSKVAIWMTGAAIGIRLSDPMSGIFVMRRDFYSEVRGRLSLIGFKILIDLLASAGRGVAVVEQPTFLRPRRGGTSKLDFRVMADLAALLIEKRSRGLAPARLIMFGAVGMSGVLVNLAAYAAFGSMGTPPLTQGTVAVLAAMIWNFLLNNLLTFRDRRLQGAAFLRGLMSFILLCSVGAALNGVIAFALRQWGAPSGAAWAIGAVIGGVFNFWSTRRLTWGSGEDPSSRG